MPVNGETEVGVARNGDKAEPVTVRTAHEKNSESWGLESLDRELTVFREQHSLPQEGRRGHRDSDPYR